MEIFRKKLAFSFKLLKTHFFLHFISYGFSALNFTLIFIDKKKFFVIIFLTVQTILLLFISQMICLLKSSFFSAVRQIKCILNIYAVVFIIFFILIIVQYILIFKMFNLLNDYKIVISTMGMLYYIFDGLIFVNEYYIIFKQIKNSKTNRMMMQTTNPIGNSEKICKNETMDSDKAKKIENEKFVKDDTIYIIYGNNNNTDNKKNRNLKTKTDKIGMKETNSTISYYYGRNKKFENKKYYNSNKLENDYDSKRAIKINEGKKCFSLKNVSLNLTIVK